MNNKNKKFLNNNTEYLSSDLIILSLTDLFMIFLKYIRLMSYQDFEQLLVI